jgi:uncharacterized protein (DUF2147 family)
MEARNDLKKLCIRLCLLSIAAAALQLVARVDAQATATQAATATASPAPGDGLLGEWWTEGNQGRVRMTRDKEGLYRGTTTCCVHKNDEDNPEIDTKNPNPALRTRSTVGILIIWKLKYEDGEYVDGHVYNPRDGKSYRIKMTIIDNETVKIRGYMGIPLLGQTQIWKRAHAETKKPSTAAKH